MKLILRSGLTSALLIIVSAAPPDPQLEGRAASFYTQPADAKIRVLFDQNDRAYYDGGSSAKQLLLIQHSSAAQPPPFGKFALFVGLIDGADGKPLSALLDAGVAIQGIKTGYSPIPPIATVPEPVSAFRLSVNPDDPNNRQKDLTYSMPSFWLSDITMPAARHTMAFGPDSDSLEYRVQLRVPLAGTGLVNQESIGYVLGGLYFEQLKNLGSAPRAPAFWYGVSMFEPRRGYVRELLTLDRWSGGTKSPIVATAVARRVVPDEGKPPRPGLEPSSPPIYAAKLDGSAELQTEPDGLVRNFGFRISRLHFQAAIAATKRRFPDLYGDHGSTPLSDDPNEFALTHFNLDAEIFHKEILDSATPERGLVVEFQNLQVIQKQAIPVALDVVGEVSAVRDRVVEGWACFSLPQRDSQSGEAENLLGLPVPLLVTALDSQGRADEVVLARTQARLPSKVSKCQDGFNGHGFRAEIPLEMLYKVPATSTQWKLRIKADLGVRFVTLPFAVEAASDLPRFDFEYFGQTHVVPQKPNLLGEFRGVKNGVARGWACLYKFDQPVAVDIVAVSPGKSRKIVASGLANRATAENLAGQDACDSVAHHGFEIAITQLEQISPGALLEAVVYPFPAARSKWSRTLGRLDGSTIDGPTLGYFEGLTKGSSGGYLGLGWACRFAQPEPLKAVLSALMANGQSRDVAVANASLPSEPEIAKACGLASNNPDIPAKTGYRYEFVLTREQFAALGDPSAVRRFRVFAYPAGEPQERVLLREFAQGSFTLPFP